MKNKEKSVFESRREVSKKVDPSDLKKINERACGWTIESVDSGTGETVFILNLVKGSNKRSIVLCANDLGGWLGTKR